MQQQQIQKRAKNFLFSLSEFNQENLKWKNSGQYQSKIKKIIKRSPKRLEIRTRKISYQPIKDIKNKVLKVADLNKTNIKFQTIRMCKHQNLIFNKRKFRYTHALKKPLQEKQNNFYKSANIKNNLFLFHTKVGNQNELIHQQLISLPNKNIIKKKDKNFQNLFTTKLSNNLFEGKNVDSLTQRINFTHKYLKKQASILKLLKSENCSDFSDEWMKYNSIKL